MTVVDSVAGLGIPGVGGQDCDIFGCHDPPECRIQHPDRGELSVCGAHAIGYQVLEVFDHG